MKLLYFITILVWYKPVVFKLLIHMECMRLDLNFRGTSAIESVLIGCKNEIKFLRSEIIFKDIQLLARL
jgi:hypothetical protein